VRCPGVRSSAAACLAEAFGEGRMAGRTGRADLDLLRFL